MSIQFAIAVEASQDTPPALDESGVAEEALQERDGTIQYVHDNAHHAIARNAETIANVENGQIKAGKNIRKKLRDLDTDLTAQISGLNDRQEYLNEHVKETKKLFHNRFQDLDLIVAKSEALATDRMTQLQNEVQNAFVEHADAITQLQGVAQDDRTTVKIAQAILPKLALATRKMDEMRPSTYQNDPTQFSHDDPSEYPPSMGPQSNGRLMDPAHTAVRVVVDPPRRLLAPENDRRPATPRNAPRLFPETRNPWSQYS